GFGDYSRRVTTTSREAQRWFDQGMQLLYGFNHDEAVRSFQQAAMHDPDCAMAYWGQAYARGIHVNNADMSVEQSELAHAAAQTALAHLHHASPVERALVEAVAERYAMPVPDDRKHLDRAYANAMESVWRRFPGDADVGALFAESLMDLQPWDYWNEDGSPKGRTAEIVAVLERVLASHPAHPGANHFYIHAVEASRNPERGIPAADRLRALVPGSGHLVHMPSHVYARVGRWEEAADCNARAVAADRAYFAVAPEPDFYSLYFVHNLHFLAYAAMMEGRYEVAMTAARDLIEEVPPKFVEEWTFLADGFLPIAMHVMIRFGRWEEILQEPAPPAFRKFSVAMHHYARGVAFSALGRTEAARQERVAFEAAAAAVPDDWAVGENTAADVLAVARCMLDGELAYRERRLDAAFSALRDGVAREEALDYDEPPGWMQPVRHALGALLMGAERPAEAEAAYRADLERHPNNGWSLLGLTQSLAAQGRESEAAGLEAELARAWARADERPRASCYCGESAMR
ncbi:MAG: hypothetical protein KDA05_03745, partial [Phycisphaerales bacterium]|nr:hypothetical protein [Phycisphaerales bacterium]